MLKNVLEWLRLNRTKKNSQPAHIRPFRNSRYLKHEVLEDRRMLATLTVNVNYDSPAVHGSEAEHVVVPNDDGSLTLREAMGIVNGKYFPQSPDGDRMQIDGDYGVPGVPDTIHFALPSGEDTITLGIDENGDDIDFPTIPFFPGLDLTGEIVITRSVIIDAQGQGIIVDATENDDNVNVDDGGGSRVFGIGLTGEVAQGTSIVISKDVTLAGLTIKGGDTTDDGGGVEFDFSPFQHANANNGGSLTIRDSVIVDNHAGGRGGGVSINTSQLDSGVVQLDITRSTINGNSAADDDKGGGGIYADVDGNFSDSEGVILNLTDSTVSENEAAAQGGGIWFCAKWGGTFNATNSTVSGNRVLNSGGQGGGVWIARSHNYSGNAVANLKHVTITNNSASVGGGLFSDPVVSSGQGGDTARVITSLTHTIVSENEDENGSGNANNIAGSIEAASSYNFIGASTAALPTGPGNITTNADDPGLMPLAYYGGPTKTHAPLQGSPVIDAGDPALTPSNFPVVNGTSLTTDQRGAGFTRIYDAIASGAQIDIGAVEYGANPFGAPRVIDVIIGGTDSVHSDYSFADSGSVGSGEQLRTVPVGGANKISVRFNEPVFADKDDLELMGFFTGTMNYVDANTTFTGSGSALLEWTFDTVFAADKMNLVLNDAAITDFDGLMLDGEWYSPSDLNNGGESFSEFPSGDGNEGGYFGFFFSILPGDFDRDNDVDGSDFVLWMEHDPSTGDANGDGIVDGIDLNYWMQNWGFDFTSWS